VNLQNIRAVLVSQRGELQAERYYQSDAAEYLEIQSATKGVISTLVGIALTKGDLKSLDQTLGELLPQHRSAMSQSSAGTSVRQLLTMTAGWTTDYDPEPAKPQLVRRVLRAGPDGDPGTFAYSDIGPHLLSAVMAQATGMSTLAYARRELFDPLGIDSQPAFEGPVADVDEPDVVNMNSFRWLRDPDGVHAGPFGLALTARDMIKIGELWLKSWGSPLRLDNCVVPGRDVLEVAEEREHVVDCSPDRHCVLEGCHDPSSIGSWQAAALPSKCGPAG
jgi:CubicO group peptidase (beta-lactamase class C family)